MISSFKRSLRQRKPPKKFKLLYDGESEEKSSESELSSREDSSDENSDEKCAICHRSNPPKEKSAEEKVKWIGCDVCLKWYHKVCEDASEEDIDAVFYSCKSCI